MILGDALDVSLVLDAARKSLDAYIDARHRLGARIVESGIHAALTVPGVEEVRLSDWSDVICSKTQAPYCSSINVMES